jgi:hypothetical protein
MEIFGPKMRQYIDFHGAKLVAFGTPAPLHGVNPRLMMGDYDWDKVRKDTYAKSNNKCAICGDTGLNQGFPHAVEAHEIWDYDFKTCTQIFMGLVALCPICHKVIHWAQNEMALNSGTITREEFNRQQILKRKKLIEVNGREIEATAKKPFPWHDGNWVSDFSYLKELYPNIHLKTYFDTGYNGYFSRQTDSYIYKQAKNIKDVLF